MADQNDPQMTRDDANIHLGFTYLREDLQEDAPGSARTYS